MKISAQSVSDCVCVCVPVYKVIGSKIKDYVIFIRCRVGKFVVGQTAKRSLFIVENKLILADISNTPVHSFGASIFIFTHFVKKQLWMFWFGFFFFLVGYLFLLFLLIKIIKLERHQKSTYLSDNF